MTTNENKLKSLIQIADYYKKGNPDSLRYYTNQIKTYNQKDKFYWAQFEVLLLNAILELNNRDEEKH